MYRIVIKKSAVRELESLPSKILSAVTKAILNLSYQPRPRGCKKLKGQSGYLWRIRIGDYRVIYSIDDVVKIIDVQKIGHRKNVYE